jgi:hypothetical protein
MGEVSTIGLDIAKSVFQISRGKVLGFLRPCRPASLALKPARALIIGAASFRRSAIR